MIKKAAGILFTDGEKILLLKRAEGDGKNTWGLPGGGAKGTETALETAKRETQEECGIDEIPGNEFSQLTQEDSKSSWTTFLYSVNPSHVAVKLSHEHSDWKWFEVADLGDATLHPKLKPQISAYLALIRRKFCKKFTEWAKLRSICS